MGVGLVSVVLGFVYSILVFFLVLAICRVRSAQGALLGYNFGNGKTYDRI